MMNFARCLLLLTHVVCVRAGWGIEYETTILVRGNYRKGHVLFRSDFWAGSNSRDGGWALTLDEYEPELEVPIYGLEFVTGILPLELAKHIQSFRNRAEGLCERSSETRRMQSCIFYDMDTFIEHLLSLANGSDEDDVTEIKISQDGRSAAARKFTFDPNHFCPKGDAGSMCRKLNSARPLEMYKLVGKVNEGLPQVTMAVPLSSLHDVIHRSLETNSGWYRSDEMIERLSELLDVATDASRRAVSTVQSDMGAAALDKGSNALAALILLTVDKISTALTSPSPLPYPKVAPSWLFRTDESLLYRYMREQFGEESVRAFDASSLEKIVRNVLKLSKHLAEDAAKAFALFKVRFRRKLTQKMRNLMPNDNNLVEKLADISMYGAVGYRWGEMSVGGSRAMRLDEFLQSLVAGHNRMLSPMFESMNQIDHFENIHGVEDGVVFEMRRMKKLQMNDSPCTTIAAMTADLLCGVRGLCDEGLTFLRRMHISGRTRIDERTGKALVHKGLTPEMFP